MNQTRILIVEDSPVQRNVYKEMLLNAGYEVIEAADGEEGLKKTKTENPDVIISDLELPKMGGFEMIKKIKNDENMKYIPIICISATFVDMSSKLKGLLEAGAEEYFYLPQNLEELLAKVVVMTRIRRIYLDLLEKNKQLKIFNSTAVNRELKMVELKEKIRELEKELEKYKK